MQFVPNNFNFYMLTIVQYLACVRYIKQNICNNIISFTKNEKLHMIIIITNLSSYTAHLHSYICKFLTISMYAQLIYVHSYLLLIC